MKSFFFFTLGIVTVCAINATFETDLPCHYMQTERQQLDHESPQMQGFEKKSTYEIFTDRITRVVVSNEVIWATNSKDTGMAVIKMEPVDPRREH